MTDLSSTKSAVSPWEWLVPGAIAAILVACCIVISPKKPIWFDEVITWSVATDPSLGHMLHSISTSADLPLIYYLLAQLWWRLFGDSVLALRLLSSFAFSGAVFASWAALRRGFSFAATAFAHVSILCTSTVLIYEDVELRSYGIFLLVMALAILLYARLATTPKPSARLLIATGGCHAALVLCHIYGLAYSAALLIALIAYDFAGGSWHLRAYAAIAAGWLAIVPSLLPLVRLATLGQVHTWNNVPAWHDLLTTYDWPDLPLLIAATCVVLIFAKPRSSYFSIQRIRLAFGCLVVMSAAAVGLSQSGTRWNGVSLIVLLLLALLAWRPASVEGSAHKPLLYLALTLLALPLTFFVAAQFSPSIFAPRYFLPSILAIVILLAAFLDNGIAWFATGSRYYRCTFAAALISLLVAPLYGAVRLPANDVPNNGVSASVLDQLAPGGLPIAVEDPFAFLPLYFHERRGMRSPVYVLNRQAAEASRYSSAVINFDLIRRLHAYGYLQDHVVMQQEFLADHPSFLVLRKPGFAWFDLTLARNPAYSWRKLGELNGSELIIVQRANHPHQPSSRIEEIK